MQLILSHVGTDFDGLASMVLAQKLYPGSKLVFPGRMGSGVAEFYALHRRHYPAVSRKKALNTEIDLLVLVDTRQASRLGPFRNLLHKPNIELHIYDHHPPSAEAVKGDQEWVEPVGAAVTLLVERCLSEGVEIRPDEASLGLIALHEETGSFRYESTTDRDLAAAAQLLKRGANLEVVSRFLRDPLTPDQRGLLEEFLSSGEFLQGPGGSVYLCSATREKSVFGLGLLASRVLEVEGTDAVCAVLSTGGDSTSLSARSQSDQIDVARWMQLWGGGGHPRAAAASGLDEPLEETLAKLRQLVGATAEGGDLTAADLMSVDVFSLTEEVSVREAMDALISRGHNAACIVNGEGIMGIVSRSDLGRALEHDLGHAPATSVMTHRVVNVTPQTPLEEVRRIVVERDVGTLPVLEEGRLVGIVSRTDLLREMYQMSERVGWNEANQAGRVLDLNEVGEPYRGWLRAAAKAAEERHTRIYAVGGFVRDRLLGRASDDLDLVVEGDALEMAGQLAKRLGGRLITHEKYLTAAVKFENGRKLDLATARREVYCRPAALPEVAQSNLKADLYRRDFTINSLALRVNSRLEGTVIDFFGGLKDLEGRAVRVLHNHSFFDDPTRILRAVRFEQRLGFQIEPHTIQLLRAALKEDVLRLAKPERLREELRLALSEADPIPVLRRLSKLKILSKIHPELHLNKKVMSRLERALELRERFPDLVAQEEFWKVPLFLLGFELTPEAAEELREVFGWPEISWPWSLPETLGRLSDHELCPSEVGRLLDPLSPVQILLLGSLTSHVLVERYIIDYVTRTRDLELLVTGDDIMELGVPRGPQVKRWKRLARDAQRDRLFEDREQALKWLKDVVESDPGDSQ